MQLSPTYRALLRVIPDLSWIYNFKAQLGRGRCPWVHGMTKTRQKISRFLKKGLIPVHVWVSDSEIVSVKRDRIYEVSQDECTCPEWKHRISKDKGYRHIPELFKGYVDCCKHQVQHWLRSHDVSKFSEFIDTIDPQEEKLQSIIEHSLPEGIKLCRQEGDMGIEYRFAVVFSYWKTYPYGPPTKERQRLGDVSIGIYGELNFRLAASSFWKEFPTLIDGINYLMKCCCRKYSEAIEPEWVEPVFNDTPDFEDWEIDAKLENCDDDFELFAEIYPNYYKAWKKRQDIQVGKTDDESLNACRDLFGDDMYPQPVKPQKKWLSFSDLTG